MSFQKDTLTVAGLKKLTHDLKQAIQSVTGLEVPLHQVQEIAARQLGEASWHDAYAQAKRVRPDAKPKTETASPEWVVWARMNLHRSNAQIDLERLNARRWQSEFLNEPKEALMQALNQGHQAQFQNLLTEFDLGVESLIETAQTLPPEITVYIKTARFRILVKLMESSIEAPDGGPVFAQMWDRLQESLHFPERKRIVRHAIENPITFDHLIQQKVPDLEDFDDLAFVEMAFEEAAHGGSEESWALLDRMYALNKDPKKAQEMVMLGLDADEETLAKALHRLVPASERSTLLATVALMLHASGRSVDVLGKANEEARRLDVQNPILSRNESDTGPKKRRRRPG